MSRPRALAGLCAGALLLSACGAAGSAAPASRSSAPAAAGTADPSSMPDDRAGPRLHLTSAGPCPTTLGDAVGVRNDGPAVTDALVPAQAPAGGLVCDYAHGGPHRYGVARAERLDAATAAAAARALRALSVVRPPAGVVRPSSCPPGRMLPTPTRIVVLAFPGRPDVAVWQSLGCGGTVSGNGWVRAMPR